MIKLKIQTSLFELVEMGEAWWLSHKEAVEHNKILAVFAAIDERIPESG